MLTIHRYESIDRYEAIARRGRSLKDLKWVLYK
jgi:hypothetical protein